MKKKVLIIFGTRPEFIKLYPVILEFNKKKFKKYFSVKICFSGQHIELVENLINRTNLSIDYKLNVLSENQSLEQLTSKLISGLEHIVKQFQPDITIVQGDTTTAFAGGLVSFYNKVKIAHVEAGLRTYQKYSPFPEEINRKILSVLADYNFAPTEVAKNNLINEGANNNNIFVSGNTVIDACRIFEKSTKLQSLLKMYSFLKSKYVLITFHRRENFGPKAIKFLNILKKMAKQYYSYNFVFSVHMNPNIKNIVYSKLSSTKNIILLDSIDYIDFVYFLKNCSFILTDSGGLQEEAFYFNKSVLVLRDFTERVEGLDTGKLFLVGMNENKILGTVDNLFKNHFNNINLLNNPFGDGYSSERIVKVLLNKDN